MYSTDYNRQSMDAIAEAQKVQRQISEKELEIEMQAINNRYATNNKFFLNDFSNQHNATMVDLLKDKRDMYISSALYYSLRMIEQELSSTFNSSLSSMIYILSLVNISSFVRYQAKNIKLDQTVKELAYQIDAKLMMKGVSYFQARTELQTILNASHRQ